MLNDEGLFNFYNFCIFFFWTSGPLVGAMVSKSLLGLSMTFNWHPLASIISMIAFAGFALAATVVFLGFLVWSGLYVASILLY